MCKYSASIRYLHSIRITAKSEKLTFKNTAVPKMTVNR